MKMLKICLVSSLFLFIPLVAATNPTTIEIQPSALAVNEETTFTITFYVSPSEIINTVATDLITWNPQILECISIERGNLFETATIWIEGTIDNSEGKIINMCWGSTITTDDDGIFVTIDFKAKNTGTTNIVIDYEKFGVANNGIPLEKEIINNCEVTVINPPDDPPDNPPDKPDEPDEIPDEPDEEEEQEQNTTQENETIDEQPIEPDPENEDKAEMDDTYIPIEKTTQKQEINIVYPTIIGCFFISISTVSGLVLRRYNDDIFEDEEI